MPDSLEPLRLSVSAFGSNHLQHRSRVRLRVGRMTFSIRIRIESSATDSRTRAATPSATAFSIRIRIESSATRGGSQQRRTMSAFQYPHSDRIICNSCVTGTFTPSIRLSVSAFGSNHLQPIYAEEFGHGTELSVSAFGSNHLQRTFIAPFAPSGSAFSIRIRIESSATNTAIEIIKNYLAFQYPHSDRIICNISPSLRLSPSASFSIRIRIESSATLAVLPLVIRPIAFSIRIRIESSATRAR